MSTPSRLASPTPRRPSVNDVIAVGLDRRRVGKRQHILAVACDLLLREGPGAVTVTSTAQRADVSPPTVRKHWQSREELVGDTLDYARITDPRGAGATEAGRLFDYLDRLRQHLQVTPIGGTSLAEMVGRAPRNTISADNLATYGAAQRRALEEAISPRRVVVDDVVMARILGPIVFQILVMRTEASNALLGRLVLEVVEPEGNRRSRRPL